MEMDHAVIWVNSARRSLDFYTSVLGLKAERVQEFEQGYCAFPSVRINRTTIIDIMELSILPSVQKSTGGGLKSGKAPLNHLCLSVSEDEYHTITSKLNTFNIVTTSAGENVFGAQGFAIRSTYFNDPDGNVLEVRYYQHQSALASK